MNNEKLIKQLEAEYNIFIKSLEKENKRKIIDHAYEITIKKEILYLIPILDSTTLKKLSKVPNLLNFFYNEWLRDDSFFSDNLKNSVLSSIESLKNRTKLKESRQ